MNYRSFLYFPLIPALLITAPCYAMDITNEEGASSKTAAVMKVDFGQQEQVLWGKKLVKLNQDAQEVKKKLEEIEKMQEPSKKNKSLQGVAAMLIPLMREWEAQEDCPKSHEVFRILITHNIADRFFQGGRLFFTNTNSENLISRYTEASECLESSCKLYNKYESETPVASKARQCWEGSLERLVEYQIEKVRLENDPVKKIATYLQVLERWKKQRSTAQRDPEKQKTRIAGIRLALTQGEKVYFNILSSSQKTRHETASFNKYQSFLKNRSLLEDLLKMHNYCLVDSFIPRELIVKQEKSLLFAFHDDYTSIISTTVCAMLKGASWIIMQIPTVNSELASLYQQKGQEHLNEAVNIYKEKLYQNEYADEPKKEHRFIEASLEFFIGNDQPLKDFYKRERIVRRIKKEQEEKLLQEQLAKEKEVQQQQVRQNRVKTQVEMTAPTPEIQSFENEPEEKYKIPEERVKPKTHFIGPMLPPVPTASQPEEVSSPPRQTIPLEYENYVVFQRLTGGPGRKDDGNLTLKRVLGMFDELAERFVIAKGSHNMY